MSWMNFFAFDTRTPAPDHPAPAPRQLPWIALRAAGEATSAPAPAPSRAGAGAGGKPEQQRRQVTPFLVATNPINPVTKAGFEPEIATAMPQISSKPQNPTPDQTKRTPVLRVVCIGGTVGSIAANDVLTARLRISGRACDVRAELDRMVA